MSINKEIDNVWQLDQKGKREAAWSLLRKLICDYPNNARLLFLQAALHARDKNYIEAIKILDKAIVLSPQEATYYFHRGVHNFELSCISEAVSDFSDAISRDSYEDISFTHLLYFYRAEAYIKLGQKYEAFSDLSSIPDDYQTWTFELRSKSDLLADCSKL